MSRSIASVVAWAALLIACKKEHSQPGQRSVLRQICLVPQGKVAIALFERKAD